MSMYLLLFLLGLVVVIFTLGIFYLLKSEKAATRNTSKLAKKLDLAFSPGTLNAEPVLQGTYQGIPIVVQSVVTSVNPVVVYATTYTATLSAHHIPLDLVVYREGFFSKVAKAFGSEDIQLNDPELDNAFIIKGSAHHDTRALFARPNIKNCFLEMARENGKFRLENKTLIFDLNHRMIEEGDALKDHIDRIVAYANTLNNSTSTLLSLQEDPTDLLGESTTLEVFAPHETTTTT